MPCLLHRSAKTRKLGDTPLNSSGDFAAREAAAGDNSAAIEAAAPANGALPSGAAATYELLNQLIPAE